MINRQVLDLWNRYKPTIAVDAIEYDRELKKLLGTNLAEVGTDCISRQQAIDAVDVYMKRLCRYIGASDDTRAYAFARGLLVGIKTDIGELPSAQPMRGRWIEYNYPGSECVYCNQCKTEYYPDDLFLGGNDYPNFCPNCGADMRNTT